MLARARPVRVFSLPGTLLGTRVELAYLPGRAPSPSLQATKQTRPKPHSAAPKLVPAVPAKDSPALLLPSVPAVEATTAPGSPNLSSPASATPDASSGSDAWGSGSVSIALTTFSPSPQPDLSSLPHGVQGDVVVDVTIDPSGKVAELAVLHTLGYGIESSVIGTLKTWTFRPATKDGAPIASVQELHFHFGPV